VPHDLLKQRISQKGTDPCGKELALHVYLLIMAQEFVAPKIYKRLLKEVAPMV
jgi:hypothetical protein